MTERVDSKALLVTFLFKILYLIIFGLAGALVGSSLYLLIATQAAKTPNYTYEKEFYITFTYDWSKDYYNDYTWNDVLHTDDILGKVIAELEGVERDEIKEMISSRVYSDVRYLTVYVKGSDRELVENVGNLLEKAIIQFADTKEELGTIECVERGAVKLDKVDWFTLRAMLLGMVTFVIIYIIGFIWSFSNGQSFYTRNDIENRLDIKGLCVNEVDALKDTVISPFISIDEFMGMKEKTVVIEIKQGEKCKANLKELLITANNYDIKIKGAILTNCNKKWLSAYGLKNYEGIYGVK